MLEFHTSQLMDIFGNLSEIIGRKKVQNFVNSKNHYTFVKSTLIVVSQISKLIPSVDEKAKLDHNSTLYD